MRVLLLTSHLDIGGVGVYTLSLAVSLKRAGVDVIVSSGGGALAADLERYGIEHIRVPVNTSSDIGLHTLISIFRLSPVIIQRGIDIIHAQTRVTQIIAHILSRRTGAVFISTCHGFFKMRLFRRMFPCWGAHTIAISDAVRQHLVCDLGVAKDDISVIYNGIDAKIFTPHASAADKALIKKQYSLHTGPVIGIISRLSEVKGHKYLLGAFASVLKNIPDAQLLIVGDGPRRYRDGLNSLITALGISSRVYLHPACRDTVIPLSVIDVFCHPSLQEGLGLSILEAMAMGLPVVASNVGGIYTLIRHKVNGLLVPPMDEHGLAKAISRILSDKDMADRMGRASREIVLRDFTLDMSRDKIIELYEGVKPCKG
jgi:glycosyltransferase involved in cell wall biosynthesis